MTKIGGGLGQGNIQTKFRTPYLFLQPLKLATKLCTKFGTQLGFGTSLPKTSFSTKISGGLGKGSIRKKIGTLYVFLQPLKLATSNLVHKFGLGPAYQKTTFRTKIGGV